MDNFKFILLLILAVVVVVLGGYWAVASMQSGSEHVNAQKVKILKDENESLKEEVKKLNTELATLQGSNKQEQVKEESAEIVKVEEPKTPVKTPAKTTTYKNQTLINEIQKLADKGVVLKLKSASPAVGSVQKFLNLYNKTKNKVDNDYGASTKTAVAAFQKAQGLTASGEAGKATFTKMVSWLKKQG